jgi:hypothetical protein
VCETPGTHRQRQSLRFPKGGEGGPSPPRQVSVTANPLVASPGVDDNMQRLDEHDETIIALLGYAVARAQLFEYAMAKLLEVQRHDPAVPLDERWPEITTWLTAGGRENTRRARLPRAIKQDLRAVVEARNAVAHVAYCAYVTGRGNRGDCAVDEWSTWLGDQTDKLGPAYNGVMSIVAALREEGLDEEGLLRSWRTWIPAPIEPLSYPAVASP